MLAAGGCEGWRSVKIDHPVLGPPPPRLSYDEPPQSVVVADASGDSGSGYVKVGLSEPGPMSDHAVVAIVNGEPLLAGELLAPFRPYIVQARSRGAADWQLEQLKKAAIEKLLDERIDQTLLVQSLKQKLSAEQLKQIDEKLTEEFAKECRRIMEQMEVDSKVEVERQLAEQGTSLYEYEQAFKTGQLAMLCREERLGGQIPVIGRRELLEYYYDHADKYEHPARVQFQLLMVSFQKNGGPDGARQKLDAALAELDRGEAFPDVAQRYSDGPNADRGGQWDWLKPGEFADRQVDSALFELPVGEPSGVFQTSNAFVVVKVTDREPAGRTPFAEVQDEIRVALLQAARDEARTELLAELRESAVITTYLE